MVEMQLKREGVIFVWPLSLGLVGSSLARLTDFFLQLN